MGTVARVHRVRRSIAWGVSLLLIGAAINLGIAWALESGRFGRQTSVAHWSDGALGWVMPAPVDWPAPSYAFEELWIGRADRLATSVVYHEPGDSHRCSGFQQETVRTGWPFAAM